ncbi:MAG: hypothetical protein FDZ69_04615 [Deltaproteobacteria bacterium]|nr:MAG: hypothetical protein FDZ69_04615 [Deltaproteobacteria bacterium]
MTTTLPIGPFISAPLKQESSGVDFLGLRQANLDMMDECLPGINNYTRYVRVFSVISWIYWKFHEQAQHLEIQNPTDEQMTRFKEKAEILFTWGHRGVDPGGIPGITSVPPTPSGDVDLSFDAWSRSPDNTSLLAAPTYGPASKTTGGLGFIEPVKKNFYRTRGHGVKLAQALDRELAKCEGYSALIGLDLFSGDECLAESLLPAWDVRTPSDEERAAFRESFYDQSTVGGKNKIARRSLTISWLLKIMEAAGSPMTLAQIRQAMAYRHVEGHGLVGVDDSVKDAWLAWLILQTRQAQRLGFEALLAWVEDRVLYESEKSMEDILRSALTAIKGHPQFFVRMQVAGDLLSTLGQRYPTLDDYLNSFAIPTQDCIFRQIDVLLDALKNNSDDLVPVALKLLATCAHLTRLIRDGYGAPPQLSIGGRDRVSLSFWCDILDKWAGRPLNDFLLYLLENLILSQHFGVAASRFDGNGQRLRLTIEEEGLTPMVSKRLEPFIGDDRLHMALLLLADSGVIAKTTDESFLALPWKG